MINNDILRSIRYILNVGESKLVEIAALGGHMSTRGEFENYLRQDDDADYKLMPDRPMSQFLNGLVIFKRGNDQSRPPAPIENHITNNIVCKKIRVAFELKDTDILRAVARGGFSVSKTEIGAFFRSPDHRNYRECGDQFLRYFLKGLTP